MPADCWRIDGGMGGVKKEDGGERRQRRSVDAACLSSVILGEFDVRALRQKWKAGTVLDNANFRGKKLMQRTLNERVDLALTWHARTSVWENAENYTFSSGDLYLGILRRKRLDSRHGRNSLTA